MNNRKWWNPGVFIGLVIIVITVQKVHNFWKLPELEDYKVDLSYFQGRIYPAERIEPGTFAIKQFDFEEIRNWGKDAIMTFGFYYKDSNKKGIVFKVWRPDIETDYVFQYSEKIFKTSNTITSLERDGNIFYASQRRDEGWTFIPFVIFSMLSGVLIFFRVAFYFSGKKEKDKTTL